MPSKTEPPSIVITDIRCDYFPPMDVVHRPDDTNIVCRVCPATLKNIARIQKGLYRLTTEDVASGLLGYGMSKFHQRFAKYKGQIATEIWEMDDEIKSYL